VKIRAKEIMREASVTIRVTGLIGYKLRLRVAMWLIRLAARIAWMTVCFEGPGGT